MKTKSYIIIISVFIFFFVFLMVIDVGTLVNAYQHKDYSYLSTGVGGSMEPVIHNGDMLVVLYEFSPGFTLEVGDIMVYWYDYETVIGHRIIDIRSGKYYVQGDTVPFRDDVAVERDDVIGKVIGIIDGNNIIGKKVVDLYI